MAPVQHGDFINDKYDYNWYNKATSGVKEIEVDMEKQLADRQLPYLFFYSFIILFVGMGLMPVLPLYAANFGASSSITGIYLSVIYVSITISTIMTSWLGLKLGRKRLFVLSAALGAPALA